MITPPPPEADWFDRVVTFVALLAIGAVIIFATVKCGPSDDDLVDKFMSMIQKVECKWEITVPDGARRGETVVVVNAKPTECKKK